jgi:hypothetical protein
MAGVDPGGTGAARASPRRRQELGERERAQARSACAEAERAREVLEASVGVSDSQEQVRRGLRRGRARGRAAPEQNARTAQA